MGSLTWVRQRFEVIWSRIMGLREAGQKEYAGGSRAFGNFERIAGKPFLARKGVRSWDVLWIYFTKHLDGIEAYLEGYASQREDVRGRIRDAIVYLMLLHCMIDEVEGIEGEQ